MLVIIICCVMVVIVSLLCDIRDNYICCVMSVITIIFAVWCHRCAGSSQRTWPTWPQWCRCTVAGRLARTACSGPSVSSSTCWMSMPAPPSPLSPSWWRSVMLSLGSDGAMLPWRLWTKCVREGSLSVYLQIIINNKCFYKVHVHSDYSKCTHTHTHTHTCTWIYSTDNLNRNLRWMKLLICEVYCAWSLFFFAELGHVHYK